jgi:hypothetical protein
MVALLWATHPGSRSLPGGLLLFEGGVRFFSRQQYFAQNKEIAEYEKERDWKGLLRYAKDNQGGFNDVNWSTTFSKLGRFKRDTRTIVRDPDFRSIMKGLEERVEGEGIKWLGTQAAANTVHALGRIGVRSSVVLGAVDRDCERIVREGKPQCIANTTKISERRMYTNDYNP